MSGEAWVRVNPRNRDELVVSFDYDAHAVRAIKRLPNRHFNGDDKTWRVPSWALPDVVRALESVGFVVHRPPTASVRVQHPSGQWAELLFTAIPEHLREPVFKALVRVLHPDIGGDTRLTQDLNEAWRKAKAA
ncbi:MAG: hypothetical protein AB7L13_23925 [Acidimicrobiia bacterium]